MSNSNKPYFDDCYFSEYNGLEESRHVFVRGGRLLERAVFQDTLIVGETGFGTGLNLLATVESLAAEGWVGNLQWWSVELYPLAPQRIKDLLASFVFPEGLLATYLDSCARANFPGGSGWVHCAFGWRCLTVNLSVYLGAVGDMLASLPGALSVAVDCWLLDGHSPAKNPDMWSNEVFSGIAQCSRAGKSESGTRIATYSAAGIVKQGLRAAGFHVARARGFGAKRHMVAGWYTGLGSSDPL